MKKADEKRELMDLPEVALQYPLPTFCETFGQLVCEDAMRG